MRRLSFAIFVIFGCGHGHDPFVGCGDKYTAEEEYDDLVAKTTIDCGTHAFNYPPADPKTQTIPLHYCGAAPDTSCVQNAIAGDQIAHMVRSYLDPDSLLPRERHYFGGQGGLVYITYNELGADEPAWYRHHCTGGIDATSYEVDGMTCWKVFAHECVLIK